MVWFSIVVVIIMLCFALVGLFDHAVLKNKLGLGEEFKKGIEVIGPLCLSIVGIISLVPLIAFIISKTISPLYDLMGLDPSMSVTTILAVDMGGYNLAKEIAKDAVIGEWAGTVYGSMMGATIVFSIPVGLAAIKKDDLKFFAQGTLFGIAAIPVGTFVGGLMMGISISTVLLNLIIPTIFSAIIIACLALWPKGTTKVFEWFSKIITWLGFLGLALALIKQLLFVPIGDTGAFNVDEMPFIRLIDSPYEGIYVAGAVGIMLSGALPFIAVINKLVKKFIDKKMQSNNNFTESGITGFLLSAANNMAMFEQIKDMKDDEKILNVAFSTCGAFVIGDHLAFVSGVSPSSIAPMMVAKLVGGLIAVGLAYLFIRLRRNKNKENTVEETQTEAI